MSEPLSRSARHACDIIGSSLATCATTVAKNIRRIEQQVKTSHMLGRFVVTGAEQFIRTKYAAQKSPTAPTANKVADHVADEHEQESVEQTPEQSVVEAQIPLEDYDLLTSSQVVELLGSMSPAERYAVWSYENTHRRRRTILESSRVSDIT